MQLVTSSRDAGVLGCSIVRRLRRGRPWNVTRGPRRALSPQPCAPGRLCSPPCIVIVSLACALALSHFLFHVSSLSLARSLVVPRPSRSLSHLLALSLPLRVLAPSAAHHLAFACSVPCADYPLCVYSSTLRHRAPRLRVAFRCDCALIDAPSRREGPRRECRGAPSLTNVPLANQRSPASTHDVTEWGQTVEK